MFVLWYTTLSWKEYRVIPSEVHSTNASKQSNTIDSANEVNGRVISQIYQNSVVTSIVSNQNINSILQQNAIEEEKRNDRPEDDSEVEEEESEEEDEYSEDEENTVIEHIIVNSSKDVRNLSTTQFVKPEIRSQKNYVGDFIRYGACLW
ncbi:hypothetical protein RI129_012036 [Pyrocoelia pectoralis]|uniref:Uncharacterized protein n=1 Tax=Pyrocoelia pectoralis TaxID=417401 RepID=A0AAN7V9Y1_9COLE